MKLNNNNKLDKKNKSKNGDKKKKKFKPDKRQRLGIKIKDIHEGRGGDEDHKTAVVAKEIQLCRSLAGNIPKQRKQALLALQRWITTRHSSTMKFSETDLERIWKGLFYSVWMSDKPLVQEELCDDLSKLFKCFSKDVETCGAFYKNFLKVMRDNWFGIDQHRLDKFLMLIRRVTRGFLFSLKESEWSKKATDALVDSLTSNGALLGPEKTQGSHLGLGLRLHLSELYLEEVAKVSEGKVSDEVVLELIRPFIMYTCYGSEHRLLDNISRNVFNCLIRQSDVGLDYQEKYQAWKMAGFPGGSIDAMEKVELENDNNEDDSDDDVEMSDNKPTALDPRAGHVDTILPQIPVNGKKISEFISEFTTDSRSSLVNRKRLKMLIAIFDKMHQGKYPYKAQSVKLPNSKEFKLPKARKQASELLEYLKDIDKNDELKGMNRRQRKKMLMKIKKQYEEQQGENDSDADDQEISTPVKKKIKKPKMNSSTSAWVVEDLKSEDTKEEIQTPSKTNININKMNLSILTNENKEVSENGTPKSIAKVQTPKCDKLVESTSTPLKILKIIEKETNTPESKKLEKSTSTPLNLLSKKKAKTATPTKEKKKSIWVDSPFVKNNIKSNKLLNNVHDRLNVSESVLSKKAEDVMNGIKSHNKSLNSTPGNKKVMIQLKKNTSQAVIDYFKSVKQSPEIPYDSSKKPLKTSLKPNSMPSPINPFYKKKLKLSM